MPIKNGELWFVINFSIVRFGLNIVIHQISIKNDIINPDKLKY